MTSTTANKKEISDFLWEWAQSHNDWGKLLVSKIVTSECELSKEERQTIFKYFLQSINLKKGLPVLKIIKPTYTPTSKKIELVSLSGITGVNKLAKNQTINFSKNLTTVFGENGTGKTGYSRILKTLGFSYDKDDTILSNIFTETEPKKALIKYKASENEETFEWNGANKNSELESLSVFNNNCVDISLSDRQLIVSPIGFHLFNLVTFELNELTKILKEREASLPTILLWVSSLTQLTPQQVFIASLSASSKEERLLELSKFTEVEAKQLLDTEAELAKLNKPLLEKEIQILSSSMSEIVTNGGKIRTAGLLLTKENLSILIELNKQIKILEGKTQIGIKEIAENNGINFYDTEEFQSFIKSAEDYIKIIEKPNYPETNDKCIYCQQPLKNSADNLLKNYRALLNDKTQENIARLKKEKAELIRQVSLLDFNIFFHQSTFGSDELEEPVQPKEIQEYNEKFGLLKTLFVSDTIPEDFVFDFNYDLYINFLLAVHTSFKETLTQKQDLLKNLGLKELELKNKIAELKDRKLLLDKIEEIKKVIINYKIISILKSHEGDFSSYSISTKTTEARNELVSSNFSSLFKEELEELRKKHLDIQLNFGTERGSSKLTNRIKSHVLRDILSEGEQKAIALAEFLTELQLDNTKAPVIFDDPVNSLDHNMIDDVAKRLIKLSKERQVVIFTHSVLFFNSLLFFSKQPSYNDNLYKFYNSRNEYNETGFIIEAEEEINKVNSYISKINVLIDNTPKDRPEAEVSEDGYGYLRSAIELFVEHEIFKGTVKRYQKNVALTQFIRIDGSLIDIHKDKLNEIFERCCGYIKGHSNPVEVYNSPTILELTGDFNKFKEIKEAFK